MIVLLKTANPKIERAIKALIMAVEGLVPEAENDLQVELDAKAPTLRKAAKDAPVSDEPKVSKARKYYDPALPVNDEQRMATIRANLNTLGERTMAGLIYARIVTLTSQGIQVTEPLIREQMSLKAGTSQREIGNLQRAGLVVVRDIDFNSAS